MIVKNEGVVIRRCLESVRGFIDYWLICDTGSTDDTKAAVYETLTDLPGQLVDSMWVDFGYNRTEALRLAARHADYSLILDADMIARVTDPQFKTTLDADAYLLRYEGETRYYQIMLVSNQHAFHYVGATHEYITSETAAAPVTLDSVSLVHLHDGGSRSDKFVRDRELLLRTLEHDPGDARSMFYLAQTYRDLGDIDQAIAWYQRRIAAGGWDEEVWYAKYQVGRLLARRGDAWPVVLLAYLAAYAFRPSRLEPIYDIVHHYRLEREYHTAYLFASAVRESAISNDILFVDTSVYRYKLASETAICCYWLGRHAEALRLHNTILETSETEGGIPAAYVDLAIRNRSYSIEAVQTRIAHGVPVENPIKVVVTFRNPGLYLANCLTSVLSQDYPRFSVVLIDDASTDGSADIVPRDDPRVVLVRNEVWKGGGWNLHRAFLDHCEDDDIVVVVDGDDWLASADALAHINRLYNEYDCWVLYGQFRYSDGRYGFCKPFPDADAFGRLREAWFTSHAKTFRGGLYHRIADQDPDYRCMRDRDGGWYTAAMDLAFYYPVLELAGYARTRFNERVIYVYNAENPASVHRTRREEELASNIEIARKDRFRPIDSYRR
jgi:glycosyltransferase involved in cell wall biosynthesis